MSTRRARNRDQRRGDNAREATRRPFESPALGAPVATATSASAAAALDDDADLTMASRPLPTRRTQHASATPQVTPLVAQRRTKKSSLNVAADDNVANNARPPVEISSPTVSRKRVFDASAAAVAARATQRPVSATKRSRAPPEPVFAAPVMDVSLSRVRTQLTHIDAVCAIIQDAAANQAKSTSGNRPWIAQFHSEVTDEFDVLRAKVETQAALARRVRQMKTDIDNARLSAVQAAHDRATVDAQLRAETAECDARRATVDRKAQLSNWLRQWQALKEQARSAPRDQLTHQIVPNEALDMVRATRHTRLLAARLSAARAVGAQSDAAIAALTRTSK